MNPRVPPAIQQLWDSGRQLEAIKLLRQHSGLGMKEALQPGLPELPSVGSALPPELLNQDPNRAPGEQAPGFFSGPPGLLRLIALGGALLQAWLLWTAW
jgi:hypothetical protein